jgi:hypothetical protein
MRQANVILHMNKINVVEPPKCPGFKFKPHKVNHSSHSNQGTNHLVTYTAFHRLLIHPQRTNGLEDTEFCASVKLLKTELDRMIVWTKQNSEY